MSGVARIFGGTIQCVKLIICAFPTFPQNRKPLSRSTEKMQIIIQPDGLRFVRKACDGVVSDVLLFITVILDRYFGQFFQMCFTRRKERHHSSLRMHKGSDQQRSLKCRSVVADIECCSLRLGVFRSTFPMGNTVFKREVFIDGGFQVVVAVYVRALREAISTD